MKVGDIDCIGSVTGTAPLTGIVNPVAAAFGVLVGTPVSGADVGAGVLETELIVVVPVPVGSMLYQRHQRLTCLVHSRVAMVVMRCGCCMRAFQASQHAWTMWS